MVHWCMVVLALPRPCKCRQDLSTNLTNVNWISQIPAIPTVWESKTQLDNIFTHLHQRDVPRIRLWFRQWLAEAQAASALPPDIWWRPIFWHKLCIYIYIYIIFGYIWAIWVKHSPVKWKVFVHSVECWHMVVSCPGWQKPIQGRHIYKHIPQNWNQAFVWYVWCILFTCTLGRYDVPSLEDEVDFRLRPSYFTMISSRGTCDVPYAVRGKCKCKGPQDALMCLVGALHEKNRADAHLSFAAQRCSMIMQWVHTVRVCYES